MQRPRGDVAEVAVAGSQGSLSPRPKPMGATKHKLPSLGQAPASREPGGAASSTTHVASATAAPDHAAPWQRLEHEAEAETHTLGVPWLRPESNGIKDSVLPQRTRRRQSSRGQDSDGLLERMPLSPTNSRDSARPIAVPQIGLSGDASSSHVWGMDSRPKRSDVLDGEAKTEFSDTVSVFNECRSVLPLSPASRCKCEACLISDMS
jgi:hypothetical protein